MIRTEGRGVRFPIAGVLGAPPELDTLPKSFSTEFDLIERVFFSLSLAIFGVLRGDDARVFEVTSTRGDGFARGDEFDLGDCFLNTASVIAPTLPILKYLFPTATAQFKIAISARNAVTPIWGKLYH